MVRRRSPVRARKMLPQAPCKSAIEPSVVVGVVEERDFVAAVARK